MRGQILRVMRSGGPNMGGVKNFQKGFNCELQSVVTRSPRAKLRPVATIIMSRSRQNDDFTYFHSIIKKYINLKKCELLNIL